MRKISLLFGVILLIACSENSEESFVKENTSQEVESKKLNSETLKAYRIAYGNYLFQKDNPNFSQDNVENLVLEESKKLLTEYGEPILDEHFKIEAKNESELIVKKAFERYVELSKVKNR